MASTWQSLKARIPNGLTLLRLALAFAFPFLPGDGWRLGVFFVAAASEYLDGHLSRRWGATSDTGQLLDPIADKLFVLSVVATIYLFDWVALWEIGLVAIRDVVVGTGGILVYLFGDRSEFKRMKPRVLGKAATNFQFVFMLTVLILHASPWWLVAATGLVSGVAAVDYVIAYYRDVRGGGENEEVEEAVDR